MPSLSAAIMTHPERLHLAQELQAHIGMGVICGLTQDTLWGAAVESWTTHDDSDYHLVIQDDVWCADTLISDVQYVLQHFDTPVFLSLMDNIPRKGFRWRRSQRVNNARALIMPTSYIDKWLSWCANNVLPTFKPDDVRLSAYLSETGHVIHYTNPVLVYQRHVPSVYRRTKAQVRSKGFIGERAIDSYQWAYSAQSEAQNRIPERPILYDWMTQQIQLLYPAEAAFTNPLVAEEPNIRPYTSSDERSGIQTQHNEAIFLPAFTDFDVTESHQLQAGSYEVTVSARMGHLLGGQRGALKGSGAGLLELREAHQTLHQLRIPLRFNTVSKTRIFDLSFIEPVQLHARISNRLNGNMGVQFQYDFHLKDN